MTEILKSPSFPNGLPPMRDEKVRELIRAKIRAKATYEAHSYRNTANLTEDEMVEVELEGLRLWQAYYAASLAVIACESETKEVAQ